MTVQIIGLPNALAKIGQLVHALSPGGAAAERGLGAIKQHVKETAESGVAVLTGETKESIEITDEGVTAGGAAFYLEFGTSFMDAQPFMRPSADSADAAIPDAVTALRAGIVGVL